MKRITLPLSTYHVPVSMANMEFGNLQYQFLGHQVKIFQSVNQRHKNDTKFDCLMHMIPKYDHQRRFDHLSMS